MNVVEGEIMYGGNKIVAVIQARMGSARLPGKVLMPLCQRPVLWHVIERIKTVDLVDKIIVATSVDRADDRVIEFLDWLDDPFVDGFRGPEDDVLKRFYLAMCEDRPEIVVRVTGDTPLICTGHLQKMLVCMVEEGLDGVDAHYQRSGLTLGFGSEAYRYQALVDSHLLSVRPQEREHVSLFIKRHPEVFRVEAPRPDPELCSQFRLTLDYPEDYQLLSQVYQGLYRQGIPVRCHQVIEWLRKRPELVAINSHCVQKSA